VEIRSREPCGSFNKRPSRGEASWIEDLVSFLDFDRGVFDEAAARVEPGANPFASKVLTVCLG